MSHGSDAPAWYFAENGAQTGPYTQDDMAGFARSGRLGPDTLVWAQGAPGWLPLKESPLRGLFAPPPPPPSFGSAPSAPPPPQPRSHVSSYAPQQAAPPYAAAPAASAGSRSMGFGEAISSCLGKYATFQGRAARSEFWYFQLFLLLLTMVTQTVDQLAFPVDAMMGFTPVSALVSLGLLLPNLAVLVRRLHDTNRSGFHFFWAFLPLIGWIILLVFAVERGTEGPNRFG